MEAKNCLFSGGLPRYRDLSANIFRKKTRYKRKKKIWTAQYSQYFSKLRLLAESSYCQGETLEAAARVNRYASFKTFDEIVIITTQQTSCIVLPRGGMQGMQGEMYVYPSVKRVNCDKTKET